MSPSAYTVTTPAMPIPLSQPAVPAESESRKEKGAHEQVNPINPIAVILCARSAHTLPRTTARSNPVNRPSLARSAAARSRLTFCCGVSPAGAAADEAGREDGPGFAAAG